MGRGGSLALGVRVELSGECQVRGRGGSEGAGGDRGRKRRGKSVPSGPGFGVRALNWEVPKGKEGHARHGENPSPASQEGSLTKRTELPGAREESVAKKSLSAAMAGLQ